MMQTTDFPTSWPGLSRPSTPYFLADTRGRACCRLAQRALSIVVARIVDLEQCRVRALARVEIVNRNSRVVALRISHGPLLERHVLGAEHDHQAAGADDAALFLGHPSEIGRAHVLTPVT